MAVLPGWADRSRFLEGRLCFETGRYQEALDIFKDLEVNYLAAGTEDFKQTLAAWIYRTNIYLHNAGLSHSGGLDAQLFEMEGAFLTGEYRKALELINELEKTDFGERFVFIEQPDWRSGFCQCELLLFPLRDLWDRMIHTYRALAVCHMSGGESYDKEEAIREMQRVMREEVPETDPNDAFYFYAYYRILKRTGAPEVDMNTAISIAFKRLQRRASRIDDSEIKRSFMSFHYWNSSLTVAAKEHKLI
jgi:tetratricopeptide (TPR) repeat protein